MFSKRKLFNGLVSLTDKAMSCGDFDPMYPMLEVLTKGMDKEESIWYAMTYVGHYNIASGVQCFNDYPKQVRKFKKRYPIRFQRRNLFPGNEYNLHWESMWDLKKKYGSLTKWIERGFTGDPDEDFKWVRKCVTEVRGNNRWAGMKLGEVLKYTTWEHLNPCDMGHKNSASPRKALGFFYKDPGGNSQETIDRLEELGRKLTERVRPLISPPQYHFDVAEMESCLCDFKSMNDGKFYSGKCIDVVLLTLTDSDCDPKVLDPVYKSREFLFDKRVLGEFSGWDGVDPSRDKLFVDHGKVPWRWETLESLGLETVQ